MTHLNFFQCFFVFNFSQNDPKHTLPSRLLPLSFKFYKYVVLLIITFLALIIFLLYTLIFLMFIIFLISARPSINIYYLHTFISSSRYSKLITVYTLSLSVKETFTLYIFTIQVVSLFVCLCVNDIFYYLHYFCVVFSSYR